MKNLILVTSLLVSTSYANAFVFTSKKAGGIDVAKYNNSNEPVCVFIEGSYKPVTKIAVDVANALDITSCSDKLINAFKVKGIKVIKLKKSDISPSSYDKLILDYYKQK